MEDELLRNTTVMRGLIPVRLQFRLNSDLIDKLCQTSRSSVLGLEISASKERIMMRVNAALREVEVGHAFREWCAFARCSPRAFSPGCRMHLSSPANHST